MPDEQKLKEEFLSSLKLEWQQKLPWIVDQHIISIYFGGGTPSLLGAKAIGEILSWISYSPACEITLEANPEGMTEEKMRAYKSAGINRVSIGIQSLDSKLLTLLGREHLPSQASKAVSLTFKAGIPNISIDLMYEIPHQTLASWKKTLSQLEKLPITHLSLYNLTFEPHTLFFKKKKELCPLVPSEKINLALLETGIEAFQNMGLKRYEISAFAQEGFESKHNTGYWTGRPFLGLGPSAFSYWEGKRFQNRAHLKKYTEDLKKGLSPVDFEEKLLPLPSLHERLAIALRRLEGVDRKEYPVSIELYEKLEQEGWISLTEKRAKLTEKGLLFYDTVAEIIIL